MIEITIIFILIQFSTYTLFFRFINFFQSERGIFLFHLFPGLFLTGATYFYFLLRPNYPAEILFIVTSIYGIYTVSFLELWSLSEGGFSLSIIEKLKKIETGKEKLNFDDLIQIGREKLTSRMVGLVQLGLVKKTNERVSLTSHGKICYLIFTAIRFWAFPSEKITNGY